MAKQREEKMSGDLTFITNERNRNLKASDVLNIGSGTRCIHCGMLHFLWRETCGACSKPMEYNLGFVDKENLE